MKFITITSILILILISPITTLCDFVTEDGIKVQLFKSKSKKPIPFKSFNLISENEYGFKDYGITVSEPIEKILLNGYFNDNHEDLSYRLTVFNDETKSIVLFKDTVTFTVSKSFQTNYNGKEEGTTYLLPLSPWIMSKGNYHILIERNNFLQENENRVMSIRYTIE